MAKKVTSSKPLEIEEVMLVMLQDMHKNQICKKSL